MAEAAGASPRGVLLMAYGTPRSPAEIEAYYTDIRRGRPPTAEQLADLRRRYDAIGGVSPLARITEAQAEGLQAALDARSPTRFLVALGLKHAEPRIEDSVARLRGAGCDTIVGLVLAPHYSALSVGDYYERAGKAAAPDVAFTGVASWGEEAVLVDLLAARVRDARERLAGRGRHRSELLVTAHSLPERALSLDDPTYPDQLEATAERVAAAAGHDRWRVAWQSAGRTPEPWIGPDILDVIAEVAAGDADSVIVCPAGFTADHLEVLYDVDIEAAARAREVGLELERTASLNDDPAFLDLLADLVERAPASPPEPR